MAFATHTILDDRRRLVIKVTGDVAEASTILADVSALAFPCSQLSLESLDYDVLTGVAVELLWDATTDVRIFKMNGSCDHKDFTPFSGIPNNSGAGKTGDVMMVVTGTGSYTFIASFKKQGLLTTG